MSAPNLQEEILRLNDRTYKKFMRFNLRQRVDMIKAEEKARSHRGAERAAAVKSLRSEMSERSSAAREARFAAVRPFQTLSGLLHLACYWLCVMLLAGMVVQAILDSHSHPLCCTGARGGEGTRASGTRGQQGR